MNYSLALSLGHNASAVLILNGHILCGYEEERISGVKADSKFPAHAIREISNHFPLSHVQNIYVSHWATFGKVEEMSGKHWDEQFLRTICPEAEIHSSYDHHDCHVSALRAFAGEFDWEIIADGFGNFNETISIYHDRKLIHRVFGFDKSLGLLYQYATAFLGLKMNQDEFKLLGYESTIVDLCTAEEIGIVMAHADKYAKKMFERIMVPGLNPKYDLVAGLSALPEMRMKVRQDLEYLVYTKLNFPRSTDQAVVRAVVAFFVQRIVETVMSLIVDVYDMNEVSLSGGLFMNVKLNTVISEKVKRLSVIPLCGDQGAGIGAYNLANNNLVWPNHLYWGIRELSSIENEDRLFAVDDLQKGLDLVDQYLDANLIVNFVYASMEFGARALGQTTTFAQPTKANVEYINHLNNRSTIMPMAGMISDDYLKMYREGDKIHKSLEYMIITRIFKGLVPSDKIMGCHHKHPLKTEYTNRMQLIRENNLLHSLLKKHQVLINTSFNKHGVPIVYTPEQILETHRYQVERDHNHRVLTVVVR